MMTLIFHVCFRVLLIIFYLLLYWNWAVGSAIQYPVCHRVNHAQSPIKVMYAHKPIYCQLTSIIGFISWYWVFVVYPVGSAELTNKPISKINSKLNFIHLIKFICDDNAEIRSLYLGAVEPDIGVDHDNVTCTQWG